VYEATKRVKVNLKAFKLYHSSFPTIVVLNYNYMKKLENAQIHGDEKKEKNRFRSRTFAPFP